MDLTPDVRVPRTAITVADLPHLPVMVVVVVPLDPMAGILMTMATADVATPDPLTEATAPLAVIVRDPPTTVGIAEGLLLPITGMAAVVVLPVPMGKNYSLVFVFVFRLEFCFVCCQLCVVFFIIFYEQALVLRVLDLLSM